MSYACVACFRKQDGSVTMACDPDNEVKSLRHLSRMAARKKYSSVDVDALVLPKPIKDYLSYRVPWCNPAWHFRRAPWIGTVSSAKQARGTVVKRKSRVASIVLRCYVWYVQRCGACLMW